MKKLLQLTSLLLVLMIPSTGSAQPLKKSVKNSETHHAKFNIRDFTTHVPISDAVITDQAGFELGSSGMSGDLALNLPRNTSLFYTIKADGYNAMTLRLNESGNESAEYEIYLPSEEVSYEHSDVAIREVSADLVKVYIKQEPVATPKRSFQGDEITFSVQISASAHPVTESSVKADWQAIGNVYVQKENGMYKVRIGPYQTQREAKETLLKVKSKGRKDAFIVVHRTAELDIPSIQEIEKEALVERVMPEPAVETAPSGEYKVRIASYLHPGAFKPDGIEKLGTLESYRKGEWTIMMLGGFSSVQEARKAKEVVVSKGFTDAAVVVDKEGILETVPD